MANQTIPKRELDELVAYVITHRADQLRELLTRNGFVSAQNLSKEDVQRAFLKAVKDSPSFRMDASQFFSTVVQNDAGASVGFASQPGSLNWTETHSPFGSSKFNATGSGFAPKIITAGGMDAAAAAAASTPTPAPVAKSSFWSTLGSVANKDTLTALLNTGLGAVSTSLTAKANKGSEERALELERLRLQQIQAQKDLKATPGSPVSGMPKWAKVSLVIGGVALVGTVIYLVARKK